MIPVRKPKQPVALLGRHALTKHDTLTDLATMSPQACFCLLKQPQGRLVQGLALASSCEKKGEVPPSLTLPAQVPQSSRECAELITHGACKISTLETCTRQAGHTLTLFLSVLRGIVLFLHPTDRNLDCWAALPTPLALLATALSAVNWPPRI